MLLGILKLICNTENAIGEVTDLVGRGAIEAILSLSDQQVADQKQLGKARGDIDWPRQADVDCFVI